MNNPTAKLVIDELNKMTPAQIVEDPRVEDKYVQLFNNIHGSQSGAVVYHKAKFDFLRILSENPALKECTAISLYGCFLDAAVCGLSLEQGSKPHVYIIPRSFKVMVDGQAKWEKRASLQISPYGELVQRMRAGQIRHADDPVIVYEGDHFQPIADEKGKRVEYRASIPRKSNKIIGAFIIINRVDGTKDCQWLLPDDIDRLRKYSERQNTKRDKEGKIISQEANALYKSYNGQIDPGFLEAKMIKHAFDTYPKVRTGSFTTFKSQEVPDETIDYGVTGAGDTFEEQQAAAPVTAEGETVEDQDGIF